MTDERLLQLSRRISDWKSTVEIGGWNHKNQVPICILTDIILIARELETEVIRLRTLINENNPPRCP